MFAKRKAVLIYAFCLAITAVATAGFYYLVSSLR
jgi:hypothetical protein